MCDIILKCYIRCLRKMIQYCYVDFVLWFDIFFEKCNICFDIENELLEDEYICELEDDIFGMEEED